MPTGFAWRGRRRYDVKGRRLVPRPARRRARRYHVNVHPHVHTRLARISNATQLDIMDVMDLLFADLGGAA